MKTFGRLTLGAIGLLSLLITHQLVWLQLLNVTGRMQSPLISLSPLDPKLMVSQPVWPPPNPLQFQEFKVSEPTFDVVAFAPRDREITLSRNGFVIKTLSNRFGRILFPRIPLREGPNEIVAQVNGPDLKSWTPSYMAGMKVNFEPGYKAPPTVIDAYKTRSGVAVRGLALPFTTVWARIGGINSPIRTDWMGAFKIDPQVPASSIDLAAAPEDFGTERATRAAPDLENAAGPELDEADIPNEQFTRRVQVQLDGDRFHIHLFARLPQQTPLWQWAQNGLMSGQELTRGLFGLCMQLNVPMNEYAVGTQLRTPEQDVLDFSTWCAGGANWVDTLPMKAGVHYEINPNQESIEVQIRGHLPKEGVRLEFHPFSALVDPPLVLPTEEVRIETRQQDQVRVNVKPVMYGKGVYVWRNQPDLNRPFGEILLAELSPAEMPAEQSDRSVSSATPARDSETPLHGSEATPEQAAGTAGQQSPEAAATPTPQRTIIDFVHAIEKMVPEKLNRIFLAVLSAVPFLGFLWILRRCGSAIPRGFAATLYAGTVTLLVLHLTIFAWSLFSVSLDFLDLALGRTRSSNTAMGALVALRSLGNIYPFLGIGIVLLLRPIYHAARREQLRPRGSAARFPALQWIVYTVVAVMTPVATLVAVATVFVDGGVPGTLVSPGVLVFTGAVLAAGMTVLWYQLYWLIRGIGGLPVKARSAIAASWSMLLLPVIPALADAGMGLARRAIVSRLRIYPFLLPAEMTNTMWLLIVSVLGALLLFEVALTGLRLSENRRLYRRLRSNKLWVVVLGTLFLMSIPLEYLVGSPGARLDISNFTALAYSVDDLLPYALVPGIILLVHKLNRDDSFVVPQPGVWACALLFSFYLTGRSANLLFIPIPLLVGYYLFTRWCVTMPAPPHLPVTREIVGRYLKYKESVSRRESLVRALEKKYTSGDLSVEDFRKKTGESQLAENEAAAMLKIEAGSTSPDIFAYGPETGPWKNAMVAVRWALILSLPFQAITLRDLLKPRATSGFPFIDVLKALLFSTSTWLLAAFVFGYFFHIIRGRSGFLKALAYSAALVIPTIPMRLIAAEPLGGAGHLLQIGELAGFALILALVAFDYNKLRQFGKSWRDLLTIYGWTGAAAYASTILLALGSSFATKMLPELLNLVKKSAG